MAICLVSFKIMPLTAGSRLWQLPTLNYGVLRRFLLANPELGTKRVCQSCEVRFYDLKRDPIICPGCGAEFDPEVVLRSRRNRSGVVASSLTTKSAVALVADEENGQEEVSVIKDNDGDEAVDVVSDDTEVFTDTGDLAEDDFKIPEPQKNVDGEET